VRCPDCDGPSKVLDSKDPSRTYSAGTTRGKLSAKKKAANAVYRRRECLDCGARWNTVERTKED
jgi:transcriptional regulator NrdR family protein